MNQQEHTIATWRGLFQQMSDNCVIANVEANIQRERADALQKDNEAKDKVIAELKAKYEKPDTPAVPAAA